MREQKMSQRAKQAAKDGMNLSPRQHGRTTDVTRRADVRQVERGHNVPPRAEINKERTNATAREHRRPAD